MLNKEEIKKILYLLNTELKKEKVKGEVYLVGGAVMCLAFSLRPSTKDLDAYFVPSAKIRKAVIKIANEHGLNDNWLNDAVKGFLSDKGTFEHFLDLSNLKVFCASAEYLLAMKCLSMRIGEEFHDIDDIKYLLRNLGITKYEDTLKIINKFYPIEKFPPKTFYALEEILNNKSKKL